MKTVAADSPRKGYCLQYERRNVAECGLVDLGWEPARWTAEMFCCSAHAGAGARAARAGFTVTDSFSQVGGSQPQTLC